MTNPEQKCVVCERKTEPKDLPKAEVNQPLIICSSNCAKQYNGVALAKSIGFKSN